MVEAIATAVLEHRSAASFYVYESAGLRIGQGADGFGLLGVHAHGCRDVIPLIREHQALRLHDDYWISFFLARQSVPIIDLSPTARRLRSVAFVRTSPCSQWAPRRSRFIGSGEVESTMPPRAVSARRPYPPNAHASAGGLRASGTPSSARTTRQSTMILGPSLCRWPHPPGPEAVASGAPATFLPR